MNSGRLPVLLSLLISLVALSISLFALRRDPLGSHLSSYDLSTPEATLRSINAMLVKEDLRALGELAKDQYLTELHGSEGAFLLANDANISVLKSIELSHSGAPYNNGVVISFVSSKESGVDHHAVYYFRRDQYGRFLPKGGLIPLSLSSMLAYVPEEQMTDEDKAAESAISEFEKKP
jgi:hypothetical protein